MHGERSTNVSGDGRGGDHFRFPTRMPLINMTAFHAAPLPGGMSRRGPWLFSLSSFRVNAGIALALQCPTDFGHFVNIN